MNKILSIKYFLLSLLLDQSDGQRDGKNEGLCSEDVPAGLLNDIRRDREEENAPALSSYLSLSNPL